MSITGKDSLAEASSGVALTAHTPSGTGATGGPWIAGIAAGSYTAPVSLAGGAGFRSATSTDSGNSYLSNSPNAAPNYARLNATMGDDLGYPGVLLARDAVGFGGSSYSLNRVAGAPGHWNVLKSVAGSNYVLGLPGASFATSHNYALELDRTVSGSTCLLTAIIDGVSYGPYTDDGVSYGGAAFTGSLCGGLALFGANNAATALTKLVSGSITPPLTITADNAGFSYTGRWGTLGTTRQTITNGAGCECVYTGQNGWLLFDVSGVTKYPMIAYWLDGVGPTRVLLDSTGVVVLTPAYNVAPSGTPPFAAVSSDVHDVRFLTNIDSEYPTSYDNFTNLRDAVKFIGIAVDSGASLLTAVPCQDYIEFLGDSITASLRLLYVTGATDGPLLDAPEIGWPEKVSQLLGLRAMVNGHGGQGITVGGTDGTPTASLAFPYVYISTAWNPTYKPRIVTVYHGTNDTTITASQYQTFLSTIRAAYPSAWIFAVVPFQCSRHVTPIQTAVTNLADPKIVFLDYSAAFTVNTDTSDGTHFNPGGAVRMAAKLAADIRTSIPTIAGGGGVSNNYLYI